MRFWVPFALPLGFLICIPLLLGFAPQTAGWAASPAFAAVPHILFGAALLLGAFFGQSRICFISLFAALTTALMRYAFFTRQDMMNGDALVLLSMIYVPALAALFYRLDERGLFTKRGGVRGLAILLSAVVVLFLLPRIQLLNDVVAVSGAALPAIPTVPAAGILAFVVAVPFLVVPRKHESPFLGGNILLAVIFFMAALAFRSELWRPEQRETVFLLWASASAMTLAWAVMESSWRSANIDELTGLPGRRSLKLHLDRLGLPYALAVADLDHFKRINDRYGHEVGDQILRFVAAHLRRVGLGRAYRQGGEEFAIVYEGDDFDAFVSAVKDLRVEIGERKFGIRRRGRPRKIAPGGDRRKGPRTTAGDRVRVANIKVTISIGVAPWTADSASPHEVLDNADKALYRAKKAGRNRVRVS